MKIVQYVSTKNYLHQYVFWDGESTNMFENGGNCHSVKPSLIEYFSKYWNYIIQTYTNVTIKSQLDLDAQLRLNLEHQSNWIRFGPNLVQTIETLIEPQSKVLWFEFGPIPGRLRLKSKPGRPRLGTWSVFELIPYIGPQLWVPWY